MKTRLTVPFLTLVFLAGALQAQVAGPNADLVNQLSTTLGSTPEQAAGAAGAIFAAAKSNMTPEDWAKVSGAVPGIDELMQKVPVRPEPDAASSAYSAAGVRGVTSLSGAFSRLGLNPDQVATAEPVVSDYVTKVAGPDVGKAFAASLK